MSRGRIIQLRGPSGAGKTTVMRQEAAGKVRDIKEDLVADKIKAIKATRQRAIDAGALVYDLPYINAYDSLYGIIGDVGCAREIYRAR